MSYVSNRKTCFYLHKLLFTRVSHHVNMQDRCQNGTIKCSNSNNTIIFFTTLLKMCFSQLRFRVSSLGSWDGTLARALASNCCDLGLIPGTGVTCGLSLLLVLFLVPRVLLWLLWFSSLHTNSLKLFLGESWLWYLRGDPKALNDEMAEWQNDRMVENRPKS